MEITYTGPFDPPAPVVHVEVIANSDSALLTALIDTGADITAIPAQIAQEILPAPVGQIQIEGVTGEDIVPTFGVLLRLENTITVGPVEVILVDFDFVVLGRDVLNDFVLMLDGPQRRGNMHRKEIQGGEIRGGV